MTTTTRIIGSYLSPYVRKVLVCLQLKGIPYEIDPIVPFFGDDCFAELNPLRRVPVLIDDEVTLADSTVICEYLEERYPSVTLLPQSPKDRAMARWYEEFADSRMGESFIWHLYNQVVIRRFVWGEAPDEAVLDKAIGEEIPSILDYLETQVPETGWLFGDISLADISIASFFRNAQFSRYELDAARWPMVAAYVERGLSIPAFQNLVPFEKICLRTPIAQHREAVQAAGAPVSTESFFTEKPRRGVLSI